MNDFKRLLVWQESHCLVLELYKILQSFLIDEKYGIISQLKRAAVSIPTNIAEGCGRYTEKEFKSFIIIASGSASEVEYLLLLSYDLNFLHIGAFNGIHKKYFIVKKMLTSLKNKIN